MTVDGFDFEWLRSHRQSCGRDAKAATAHVSFCASDRDHNKSPVNESVFVLRSLICQSRNERKTKIVKIEWRLRPRWPLDNFATLCFFSTEFPPVHGRGRRMRPRVLAYPLEEDRIGHGQIASPSASDPPRYRQALEARLGPSGERDRDARSGAPVSRYRATASGRGIPR